MANASPIDVKLLMSKIAVGAPLNGGEFTFGIFNQAGTQLYSVTNDATGLITFPAVRFTTPGTYKYTVRETLAPHGWTVDKTVYPIEIHVSHDEDKGLHATVTYPNGTPLFIDTRISETCGLVKFPELTFTEPGTFEFTLRELTPSGGGWTTDHRTFKVVVTVVPDGLGHLIATVTYPDGFPTFVDTFGNKPAHIIISACKIAIGAPLPAGKFEFGLFDEHGNLIDTTTNGPAKETIV